MDKNRTKLDRRRVFPGDWSYLSAAVLQIFMLGLISQAVFVIFFGMPANVWGYFFIIGYTAIALAFGLTRFIVQKVRYRRQMEEDKGWADPK